MDEFFKFPELLFQIIDALYILQAGSLQFAFHVPGKSAGLDYDIKMGEWDMILERHLYVIKRGYYRRFNSALAFPVFYFSFPVCGI